ncbi:LPS export ABC transporter periplasmic protein LptC [Thermodesulfobacterium sp. TA1]|uniref:LPS export ABC transporter periplasmic protein LptC n=1 Tax=Thermodesulfobacterium sp. TA1 TaxID=2234087 RepID=UPI001231D6B4|nr:LPS export ABC transporter periplasmic protein LptC [Thermodesulfobacterium sp. TA1]QER41986.1 LPS export ABC transporter periplasmic protein LptC [Thermodesulfobacterium sp. TA1]
MARFVAILFILSLFLGSNGLSQDFSIVAKDLEYSFYGKEGFLWKLKASFFKRDKEGSFLAEGLNVVSPTKGINISSKRGYYYPKEDKMVFQGNVKLITNDHGEVYTEELIFFPKKNYLFTEREVLVKKKGMMVKGQGMTYQIDQGNFKVQGRAQFQMSL